MQKAVLIGLRLKDTRRTDFNFSMDELAGLAKSAGARVIERLVQERERIDPGCYFGKGKLTQIAEAAGVSGADLIIANDPLSPAQARNLQDRLACRVIDRTQLILDIFAQRARTQEGKLQVELAQLTYLLPRLSGKGVEMSRLGGGIGTRGPGEMKLEVDRRRLRERIHVLQRAIDTVKRTRALHRRRRERQGIHSVALVGYTNAGKSTLFTRLTGSRTDASPKLFATLDPLCRILPLPGGGRCYVSDTVGFIRKLPVELVAAFRATLEEVVHADLLLHVCDGASLDSEGDARAVDRVLTDIGVASTPVIKVINKCDLLADAPSPVHRGGDIIHVSAARGDGIDTLLGEIARRLSPQGARAPARSGARMAASAAFN